jgi:hypothetical protein
MAFIRTQLILQTVLLLFLTVISMSPVYAVDDIVGTWTLVSITTEDTDSGEIAQSNAQRQSA